jgi:hypothetical protein
MESDPETQSPFTLARLEALEAAVVLFIGNATVDWSDDDVTGFGQDLTDPAASAPQERRDAREQFMTRIWDQRNTLLGQRRV